MEQDQGSASRQGGGSRPYSPRQPHFRKWRAMGFAQRSVLVPHARELRQLEKQPQTLHSLGKGGCVGGGLRGSHERLGQRVPHDRHDHRESPSAGGLWERGDKNEALGRSRGGLSTKIHMLTDALGRPMRFVLTGGQVNDATQAELLLEGEQSGGVIADKGYDTERIIEKVKELGANAVISHRDLIGRCKGSTTKSYTKSETSSKGLSTGSNASGASPHVTTGRLCTSSLSCIWPLP